MSPQSLSLDRHFSHSTSTPYRPKYTHTYIIHAKLRKYMWIIYIYVCICMFTYTILCICIYIHICTHILFYFLWVCMYPHRCRFACIYIYKYVYLLVVTVHGPLGHYLPFLSKGTRTWTTRKCQICLLRSSQRQSYISAPAHSIWVFLKIGDPNIVL